MWVYTTQQKRTLLFMFFFPLSVWDYQRVAFRGLCLRFPQRSGTVLVCAVVGTTDKGDKEAEKESIVNGVRVL